MALFAPRPMEDRASVVLPTVTCSSCSAPIPLSSLGDHVCRPPTAGLSGYSSNAGPSGYGSRNQPRQIPKPSQISIPPLEPPRGGFHGSSFHSEPSPSFKRPFANSPTSTVSSPSSLNIPIHRPSPSTLSAPSPAFGAPSPRTPSPTNPFFPSLPEQGVMVHGLGLGVGSPSIKPQGPFPTDAPLPPGVTDPLASGMPSMSSGGNAGMAGVGRRAFAAAAWGVKPGPPAPPSQQHHPGPRPDGPMRSQTAPSPHMLPQASFPNPSSQSRRGPSPVPQHQQQRGPSSQPPRGASPQPPQQSQNPYARPPQPFAETSSFRSASPQPQSASRMQSPTLSEPDATSFSRMPPPPAPILPKKSLSDRPKAGPPTQQEQPPPPPSYNQPTRQSIDSAFSSDPSNSPGGDSIAQLLKARQGEMPKRNNSNKAFFEKYKAQMGSGSMDSHKPGNNDDEVINIGDGISSGRNSLGRKMTESPVNMDDDEDSALPWAQASSSTHSSISKPHVPPITTTAPSLRRKESEGSHGSSQSSSSSRRQGAGGSVESEDLVTPSQSWEGIADRGENNRGTSNEERERDYLERIREEDEDGERVVFGGAFNTPAGKMEKTWKKTTSNQGGLLKPSTSSSTITSQATSYAGHSRSQTAPERRPSDLASNASSSTRRLKVCAKCNDTVGGAKRFVERDGVVLCEKDWKKLYLPSCRRCRKPIEKSAVSSSDGQLKGKWHRECFTCTKCDIPFEGDSFYVLDGKPWCQYHYHEENGTLCASSSCRRPIEGSCTLTPEGERFHPGHLKCDHKGAAGAQSCIDNMEEYYQVGSGRFCERHVQEALGKEGSGLAVSRADKRRTRLVDMGRMGAFGTSGGGNNLDVGVRR